MTTTGRRERGQNFLPKMSFGSFERDTIDAFGEEQ